MPHQTTRFSNLFRPLTIALAMGFLSAPALAGTQSDIEACRTAITEQGTFDISEHRLRFMSKKGSATRTLKLKAIPIKDGERFTVTCKLNRKNLVVAINDKAMPKLLTAAKK